MTKEASDSTYRRLDEARWSLSPVLRHAGGVSSERAVKVMKEMVAMFSTGDLADIHRTVHPITSTIKAYSASRSAALPDLRRLSLRREAALRLST